MEQRKVIDYEIIDHGIEHNFQGCGVAFTKFENVVTGCGEDSDSAMDDALDQIAQMGGDAEDLENRIKSYNTTYTTEYVGADQEDFFYYVSIRFNLAEN